MIRLMVSGVFLVCAAPNTRADSTQATGIGPNQAIACQSAQKGAATLQTQLAKSGKHASVDACTCVSDPKGGGYICTVQVNS
jgi:hypothetical protein